MAAGPILRTGTALREAAEGTRSPPSRRAGCTYCILAAVVALPVCARRHASRSSLIAAFPSVCRTEGPCRGRCLPASLFTCQRHEHGLVEPARRCGRTPASAPPSAEPRGSPPSRPNSSRRCVGWCQSCSLCRACEVGEHADYREGQKPRATASATAGGPPSLAASAFQGRGTHSITTFRVKNFSLKPTIFNLKFIPCLITMHPNRISPLLSCGHPLNTGRSPQCLLLPKQPQLPQLFFREALQPSNHLCLQGAMGWLGLEGTSKIALFQPVAVGSAAQLGTKAGSIQPGLKHLQERDKERAEDQENHIPNYQASTQDKLQ